ncbi:hypothetical protein TorRG33x02_306880 [Trema orientale]|uniref:Uncharacterized protein n=1 Tax=Trema orientale TaxID=63057 RepID=A0A2P5BW01_TREOI|nr:hypothetical protein TorRG33x02_306880 [Trema orientale]
MRRGGGNRHWIGHMESKTASIVLFRVNRDWLGQVLRPSEVPGERKVWDSVEEDARVDDEVVVAATLTNICHSKKVREEDQTLVRVQGKYHHHDEEPPCVPQLFPPPSLN